VDLAAAQSEMDQVARRLEEAYPVVNEGVGIKLEPVRDTLVGDVRTPLLVLLAAVGLVLLIAVVNVANLLLARGTSRMRELSVRLTLGAGKGRIVRQVLAESLLLGGVGGLAGAGLASLAVAGLTRAGPADLPRLDEVHVEPSMLAVALLVAVGASVTFGLVPAMQASRVDPGEQLREGARGSSGAALARLRGSFVIGQFGLALMLLVGAGLLTRSFMNLRAVDPGFDTENVLNVTLSLPGSRYPEPAAAQAFYGELLDNVRALPRVTAAGSVSNLLLSALPNMGSISVEGRPELAEEARQFPVVGDAASPGFFAAAGMELVTGRGFGPEDGPDDVPVAVVNETFARIFLAGRDPIGQRFVWGTSGDDSPWITVVGVVPDARRSGIDQDVRPSAFRPLTQFAAYRMDVLVRASSDPLALLPELRRLVQSLDPQLPMTRIATLDQLMAESLSQRRFVAMILAVFAGSALGLAAVGIFGMMAYLVGQRTREIGIRVALGAHPSGVLGRVFAEGLTHAGLGLAIGTVGALGLTRLVSSQLFGLAPSDPATFVGAAMILLTTAVLACFVPARRAARVDPMVALRED
jgi:putative ABC transport system permease protein